MAAAAAAAAAAVENHMDHMSMGASQTIVACCIFVLPFAVINGLSLKTKQAGVAWGLKRGGGAGKEAGINGETGVNGGRMVSHTCNDGKAAKMAACGKGIGGGVGGDERRVVQTCNGGEAGLNVARLRMAACLQLSVNLNLIHHSPTTNLQKTITIH